MKEQFIRKHFTTQTAKNKVLKAAGINKKVTYAEFIQAAMQFTYSELKKIVNI